MIYTMEILLKFIEKFKLLSSFPSHSCTKYTLFCWLFKFFLIDRQGQEAQWSNKWHHINNIRGWWGIFLHWLPFNPCSCHMYNLTCHLAMATIDSTDLGSNYCQTQTTISWTTVNNVHTQFNACCFVFFFFLFLLGLTWLKENRSVSICLA